MLRLFGRWPRPKQPALGHLPGPPRPAPEVQGPIKKTGHSNAVSLGFQTLKRPFIGRGQLRSGNCARKREWWGRREGWRPEETRMSRPGNDLVRKYLWMSAWTAATFNPAVAQSYARLRQRGRRGDVALLGHCMKKLLHQVFDIWKSGKPYDPDRALQCCFGNSEAAGETTEVEGAHSRIADVFTAENLGANAGREVGFIFAAHGAWLPAPVGAGVLASQFSDI